MVSAATVVDTVVRIVVVCMIAVQNYLGMAWYSVDICCLCFCTVDCSTDLRTPVAVVVYTGLVAVVLVAAAAVGNPVVVAGFRFSTSRVRVPAHIPSVANLVCFVVGIVGYTLVGSFCSHLRNAVVCRRDGILNYTDRAESSLSQHRSDHKTDLLHAAVAVLCDLQFSTPCARSGSRVRIL